MFPNQYRDGYCIIYYDEDGEQHVELDTEQIILDEINRKKEEKESAEDS
jgi:hypothetical protein